MLMLCICSHNNGTIEHAHVHNTVSVKSINGRNRCNTNNYNHVIVVYGSMQETGVYDKDDLPTE